MIGQNVQGFSVNTVILEMSLTDKHIIICTAKPRLLQHSFLSRFLMVQLSSSARVLEALNTIDISSNISAIASLANNKPNYPTLSARDIELSHLSKVTGNQFNLIHHKIKRYSRVIKSIFKSIQDTKSLLAANHHGQIKQTIWNAHTTELQIFTTK
jgi:hypothetical protein